MALFPVHFLLSLAISVPLITNRLQVDRGLLPNPVDSEPLEWALDGSGVSKSMKVPAQSESQRCHKLLNLTNTGLILVLSSKM